MSLFKTRTFWSTACEDEENFDQNSLLISKLSSDSDFIITGSHSNVLRIFKPSSDSNENNNLADYKITDLVVEKVLASPILQLNCGRLVSGSQKIQLAVLHSRQFSVHTLVVKEGATAHGTQNILQLNYEHKLRRAAANFIVGPFGGCQNRDFVCVQSLDGLLTFFEQESFSFCCFLPDFLLPSPLVYASKSDSFITCSNNWLITSFRYKLLSEAGHDSGENDASGKKIESDWDANLGERVIDLQVIDDPNNIRDNAIMILGERNLYSISSYNGKLKFMKKLDFSPICFTNYLLADKIISLVISETSTLLIYQNTSLKWSAQLQILPISIKRALLANIIGALVLLSEEGNLECCYLGTDPSLFMAPPLKTAELDFDQTALELATLNKIIKNSYNNDLTVTNASAERELHLNVTISPHLETCVYESNIKNAINNQMCTISIDVLPQTVFEEVQISIDVEYPFKVVPDVEFFNNLSERTLMKAHIFIDESAEIGSLEVKVAASFISNLGVPRSLTKSALLPLNLCMETCPPVKDSQFKLVLNINQNPAGLSTLFPEFAGENSLTTSSSAIGFKNVTEEGKIVTVLLAKSSERYRLQSDSFASLSILIEQLIHRLRKQFGNKSDFKITYNSALPTTEIMMYVHNHFNIRHRFNSLQGELSQLCAQFRLIQKRLISKFKVKNPTPLTNLQLLLEDTLTDIGKVGDDLELEAEKLVKAQNELSCAMHALANLMAISDVDAAISKIAQTAFCPAIYDLSAQNWEDVMDASLCYLLRTVVAKSDKDKLRAAHTSFDEVKDLTKFEKHFTQVVERIPKVTLLESNYLEENHENAEVIEEEIIPIGSKIAQSSSRLLSARRRTALHNTPIVTKNDTEENL